MVAHKVIIIEEGNVDPALKSSRAHIALPALKDNGKLIEGAEAIEIYLQELDEFVASWRWFQSDACYCDEDE